MTLERDLAQLRRHFAGDAPAPLEHPDRTGELVPFARGVEAGAQRELVASHLDECADCAAVVAGVRPRSRWWIAAAAAAAAIVVIVILVGRTSRPFPPGVDARRETSGTLVPRARNGWRGGVPLATHPGYTAQDTGFFGSVVAGDAGAVSEVVFRVFVFPARPSLRRMSWTCGTSSRPSFCLASRWATA